MKMTSTHLVLTRREVGVVQVLATLVVLTLGVLAVCEAYQKVGGPSTDAGTVLTIAVLAATAAVLFIVAWIYRSMRTARKATP